ncbi:MAG TPA: glycerophosphodiester phosphodiesterase family protein [Verrucomicrobiae bacterium]|nr:glycerophosphodiester phosphodiesterase family protein [Verrucomicrobiae bacterium]
MLAVRDVVRVKSYNDPKITVPFSLLVLGLSIVISTVNAAELEGPVLRLINADRPLIIGHRGYPQFAPENTLPAFKFARESGADLVELDYHLSKDGVPMIMHDYTLDRTTDAVKQWGGEKIRLDTKTAAELQTLDAGKWFDPKYAGTKILRLSEALDAIQSAGAVTLVERKEGDPSTCLNLLRENQLINRLVVQAFDWEYLRKFHELEPAQILGALGPPKRFADGRVPGDRPKQLDATWLDELVKTGAKVVVWSDQVTSGAVEQAHGRGLKVWVYTINDSAAANKMLDLGVDGIITNNTGLLWRILALRAMKDGKQSKREGVSPRF